MNNAPGQPKHISDEQLLEWILSGELVIDNLDECRPTLTFRGRRKQPELTHQRGRQVSGGGDGGASRYTWKFKDGRDAKGKRRTRRIVCAKLVWMFVHKQLIPSDCHVHHKNTDTEANRHCDAQWNLEALTFEQHAEAHGNAYELPQ